jgi:nitrous oxide reductase
MSEKKTKEALDRRGFMKVATLGGAAAAASVAPGLVTPAEAYDPGKEETKLRYRETDHVKAFYRTNSY